METIASRVDAHVNVWYLLSLAGASRPSNRARNIDSQFGNEQKSGKAVPSHPFDSPSSPSSSSPNVLSALFPFLFSSFSSISTSLNRDTAFPVLVLSFLFSPFPPLSLILSLSRALAPASSKLRLPFDSVLEAFFPRLLSLMRLSSFVLRVSSASATTLMRISPAPIESSFPPQISAGLSKCSRLPFISSSYSCLSYL